MIYNEKIKLYNANDEIVEFSIRELASWRDSRILTAKPYDNNLDLMELVNEYRNQAVNIDFPVNTDLSTVINFLKVRQADIGDTEYKTNFNGVMLYSININEVDAYIAVTGMTREECIKAEQRNNYRMHLRLQEEKEDALKNFDKRVETGKQEIIEEKWGAWEEFVSKYSEPPYYLHAIDTIIKYMQLLNKEELSCEQIAVMFHEEFANDAGNWYTSAILTNIARFSSKGTDLFRCVSHIAQEKGQTVENSKKALNRLDNVNKLIKKGIPFEEAEILINEKIYVVKIGEEENLKLVNTDTNLYEGISDDNNYTILARIGDYYVTYLFATDHYTRYINQICNKEAQIATNNTPIVKITDAYLTGIPMYNTIHNKARIYKRMNEARENVNVGLILQAYKEINDFAKEILSPKTNCKAIAEVFCINRLRLKKDH